MIIIRSRDIIRHNRFLDVAIEVQKAYYFSDFVKIKGKWLNQGFVTTEDIRIPARFKIPKDKLSEWELCTEPLAQCVRNVKWRKIGV